MPMTRPNVNSRSSRSTNLRYCISTQYAALMHVKVTKFRECGRKLPRSDMAHQRPLVGELLSCQVASSKGFHRRADLLELKSGGLSEPLATLFEPKLIEILSGGMLLRGIENYGGRAYLQEWRCELVKQPAAT